MDVATRVDLPKLSPLRGRISPVFHGSFITVEDMLATLRHYLQLDAKTERALRPFLEQLRGRPAFFFDNFMVSLWSLLMKQPPHVASGTGALNAGDAAPIVSPPAHAATAMGPPALRDVLLEAAAA
jgi:hypothetical protein